MGESIRDIELDLRARAQKHIGRLADIYIEIADRLAASPEAKWREALENIAHYCDDPYRMDDYGCADGHICADIALKALEGDKP